jgi:hypothetical protein
LLDCRIFAYWFNRSDWVAFVDLKDRKARAAAASREAEKDAAQQSRVEERYRRKHHG